MDENDALSRIATIQGVINNVIPVGKDGKPERLTYVEKFDLLFGGYDEKIKEALGYIDRLKTATEADRNDFLNVGAGAQATLLTNMIKELEKIKEILEK